MEKYGFVYIWFDKKHKRYYIGCHWGSVDDGYICSSSWMKKAYKIRPTNFKRRILKTELTRQEMYVEEQKYFDMIKPEEIKVKYYNLSLSSKKPWHQYPEHVKTIGQKISHSKKGKSVGPCSPEKAAKISAAKKAKNRKFTEEHKEKLRQAKLGKKLSPEHREKVIKTLGKTEDWREAVSAASKKRWEEFRLNKSLGEDLTNLNFTGD